MRQPVIATNDTHVFLKLWGDHSIPRDSMPDGNNMDPVIAYWNWAFELNDTILLELKALIPDAFWCDRAEREYVSKLLSFARETGQVYEHA